MPHIAVCAAAQDGISCTEQHQRIADSPEHKHARVGEGDSSAPPTFISMYLAGSIGCPFSSVPLVLSKSMM